MKFDKDPHEYLKGMDRWRFRYSRASPVHVHVAQQHRDEESGHVETFTLLFENYFSLTFTIADSPEKIKEQEEQRKRLEEEEELKKNSKTGKGVVGGNTGDTGDTGDKTNNKDGKNMISQNNTQQIRKSIFG